MEEKIRTCFNQEIVNQACLAYSISPAELKELGGFESFIYEFNQNATGYILRITHSSRRTVAQISAELEFMEYLHENGVNCSRIMPAANGKSVVEVTDGKETFLVSAFTKVPGAHVTKDDVNADLHKEYGRLLGKMHRLAKTFQPKSSEIVRHEWDSWPGYGVALPAGNQKVIEKYQDLVKKVRTLAKNSNNYGLVHYDAHAGNFFLHQGELHIFDFDDSQYSWFIADIAIVLFYAVRSLPPDKAADYASEFLPAFLAGYRLENQLDAAEFKHIPLFLKLREFDLYYAIHEAGFAEQAKNFINGRQEKLENDIPYIDLNFEKFAHE